jgi:hypothetical protein
MVNMRSSKTIASAALFSLVSAASLPDTPHFYLYDLSSPTIAVVDFHNQGISAAAGQTLTERFRLTLAMYTPYSVEASGIEIVLISLTEYQKIIQPAHPSVAQSMLVNC